MEIQYQGEDNVNDPSLAADTHSADGQTIVGLPIMAPGEATEQLRRRRRRNLEGTELLARYDVETIIGEGGMAMVYRGRHKTIEKPVAIKVLDAALDNLPEAVARFLQEAQITSRIVHENVVEVTDFGTTSDGVVFSVMELLQGETLHQLIVSEGPLPPARASRIMRAVCAGLQAAHDQGIVHRDLKPENCFRVPRTSNPDFVKVLDFGVAKVDNGVPNTAAEAAVNANHTAPLRTQMGHIVGTPEYIAPEQARGDASDHRVDVYSAGALLFELLTGRRPYVRRTAAELIACHMYADVPDPGEFEPALTADMRAIVRKAMAKDPDDRFDSMAAMARALTDAQQPVSVGTTPSRRPSRPLVAFVALSAIGLIGWGLGMSTAAMETPALVYQVDLAQDAVELDHVAAQVAVQEEHAVRQAAAVAPVSVARQPRLRELPTALEPTKPAEAEQDAASKPEPASASPSARSGSTKRTRPRRTRTRSARERAKVEPTTTTVPEKVTPPPAAAQPKPRETKMRDLKDPFSGMRGQEP